MMFDWIVADPGRATLQSEGMASMLAGWHNDIFAEYDLPPGERVADLGAGDGSLLIELLSAHPERRGIVFDLPRIVSDAQALVQRRGMSDRIEVVGGDFFDAVPTADVYLLARTLHDWDDAACRRILAAIARAARPGAHLLVLENIVPPGDTPHLSKVIDLIMLALVTGRERTREEFEALLDDGRFALRRITPTATPISIIEATLR